MVFISPLTIESLEERVSLLNDERISPFLNVNEHFTLEKTLQWFKTRNLKSRFDCIFLDNTGEKIGYGGLTGISERNQNAELYMYISPVHQGKGFGFESLIELCKYGFNVLFLHKIYLYTFYSNERANRMYEKAGFVREGYLREHTLKDGTLCDRCLYGLLKSEFSYI